ncbi:CAP domain-containing protein [Lysinibacillus piscis]|uniref:SCP domain-containing protein n=1 Tax=Lysinibacillus piscis TaxID=2518931 RepID=A0ABQ5NIC0_9BACI|nr:hypothetical protein LYSBPC_11460 [Lysinibacillus sp. KH24]
MLQHRTLKLAAKSMLIGSMLFAPLVYTPEIMKVEAATVIGNYNDFDTTAHWAQDMKWAINHGLISGYANQKHPTTPSLGIGNWINPYGNLTEYQLLAILLRYKDKASYDKEKLALQHETASNYAYIEYYLAKQYGIMTKGSVTNTKPASETVTRGQMAQALASMYYGRAVTLQQAVNFMYDNGLSTGVNPAKGHTFENFGADTKLTRAHIVTFLSRYDQKAGQIAKDVQQVDAVSAYEQEVVTLVNAERKKAGLTALQIDDKLMATARAKSKNMQAENYFDHTSPTLGTAFDQIKAAGITYTYAGENIAQGQKTPQEVVEAWMNSEGHRKNILNANFSHIGVGYEAQGHYWTQQFIKK